MRTYYYVCSIPEAGLVLNEDGWWYNNKEEAEKAIEHYVKTGKLLVNKYTRLSKPPYDSVKEIKVKPKHDKLYVWKSCGRVRINRPDNLKPIKELDL